MAVVMMVFRQQVVQVAVAGRMALVLVLVLRGKEVMAVVVLHNHLKMLAVVEVQVLQVVLGQVRLVQLLVQVVLE